MDFVRSSYKLHMESIISIVGLLQESTWSDQESTWITPGVHMDSFWSSDKVHMESWDSMWSKHGVYMDSLWTPSGVHQEYQEYWWSPTGCVGECKLHLFWIIFGRFFATIIIPHHYISYIIGLSSPQSLDYPISWPYPCLSPYPSFSLFWDYLWMLFCYYHLSPLLFTFYNDPWRSYISWISHPSPLPLPVPLILLFRGIYGRIFAYIPNVFHSYMYIHHLYH